VYGEKGSGKSFSYLMYKTLSSKIIIYQLSKTKSEKIYEIVPRIKFKTIRKLLYFPLKEMVSFETAAKSLLYQIKEIGCSSL
jgi:hypothetical protein